MRHKATQALYAYWNEVRRGRRAPGRLEIAPQRIGESLPDSFILERIDRCKFRFRLAGTRVSLRFGMTLKDRDFLDLWRPADQDMIATYLEAVAERARVALFTVEGCLADEARAGDEPRTFELLILPLVHNGGAIDRLLCVFIPIDDNADVRGHALDDVRLVAAQEILPDGAPLEKGHEDRQSPLKPEIRDSRLVRQGRRQFRVYDGGLHATRE